MTADDPSGTDGLRELTFTALRAALDRYSKTWTAARARSPASSGIWSGPRWTGRA